MTAAIAVNASGLRPDPTDDPALRNERDWVAFVERGAAQRPHDIAENLRALLQVTDDRFSMGVDEQLVTVEALSSFGVVGSMDPEAMEGARPGVGSGRSRIKARRRLAYRPHPWEQG